MRAVTSRELPGHHVTSIQLPRGVESATMRRRRSESVLNFSTAERCPLTMFAISNRCQSVWERRCEWKRDPKPFPSKVERRSKNSYLTGPHLPLSSPLTLSDVSRLPQNPPLRKLEPPQLDPSSTLANSLSPQHQQNLISLQQPSRCSQIGLR